MVKKSASCRLNKGDDVIHIRERIKEQKAVVTKLANQITNCHNPELKSYLEYQLHQEQLKLESLELLLDLARKAGYHYE